MKGDPSEWVKWKAFAQDTEEAQCCDPTQMVLSCGTALGGPTLSSAQLTVLPEGDDESVLRDD